MANNSAPGQLDNERHVKTERATGYHWTNLHVIIDELSSIDNRNDEDVDNYYNNNDDQDIQITDTVGKGPLKATPTFEDNPNDYEQKYSQEPVDV